MIWAFLIAVVIFILGKFIFSLSKDKYDLEDVPVEEKFGIVGSMINDAAFNGMGEVVPLDRRSFNIYQDGQNQLIHFLYSTGNLSITWKYKYFQKEVVHEKIYRDTRNLSLFEQQRIAEDMIAEMYVVITRHKGQVRMGM